MDSVFRTRRERGAAVAIDLAGLVFLLLAVYMTGRGLDLHERLSSFVRTHEHLELDEWIPALLSLSLGFSLFSLRRWREARRGERLLLARTRELEQAAREVQTLRGIIPICASCKKVRDEQGYWHQVESYLSSRSEAAFSHSLCQDCARKLYPEYMTGEEDPPPAG